MAHDDQVILVGASGAGEQEVSMPVAPFTFSRLQSGNKHGMFDA
jgi:hypothetical protein